MWLFLGRLAGNAVLTYLIMGCFSFFNNGMWTVDFKILWIVSSSMAFFKR